MCARQCVTRYSTQCIIYVQHQLRPHYPCPSYLRGTQSETSGDCSSCACQGDLCQLVSDPTVVDSRLTWLECSLLRLLRAQNSCILKEKASQQC